MHLVFSSDCSLIVGVGTEIHDVLNLESVHLMPRRKDGVEMKAKPITAHSKEKLSAKHAFRSLACSPLPSNLSRITLRLSLISALFQNSMPFHHALYYSSRQYHAVRRHHQNITYDITQDQRDIDRDSINNTSCPIAEEPLEHPT